LLTLFRRFRSLVFPEQFTDLPLVKTDANFVERGFIPRDVWTGIILNFVGPETEIRKTDAGFQVRTYVPLGSFLFLTSLTFLVSLICVFVDIRMFPLFICSYLAYVAGYRLTAPTYHVKTVKAAQSGAPVNIDKSSALDIFRYY